MKIGLAQTEIKWEDKEYNYRKAKEFIEASKHLKVDFLLFPELSMTGFSMNTEQIGETDENSRTRRMFQEYAKTYQIGIGVGYVERNKDNEVYNCYLMIDQNGEILTKYRKIHPFSFGKEKEYYQSGNKIVDCQIRDITASTFICYDLRFPELFQIASKKAELIILAANWPESRREHWMTLLKARAIENQCFVAGVNRVGIGDGIEYAGDSVIFDPYGNKISEEIHYARNEKLIIAHVNSQIARDYQENFPVKRDRREVLYHDLEQ